MNIFDEIINFEYTVSRCRHILINDFTNHCVYKHNINPRSKLNKASLGCTYRANGDSNTEDNSNNGTDTAKETKQLGNSLYSYSIDEQ